MNQSLKVRIFPDTSFLFSLFVCIVLTAMDTTWVHRFDTLPGHFEMITHKGRYLQEYSEDGAERPDRRVRQGLSTPTL